MIAVDTSVAVAAFASWHERHEQARLAIRGGAKLPVHCALECLSVLTRLPPPHRAPPSAALRYLLGQFRDPWLTLEEADHRALLGLLVDHGIGGGSVYDGLVAWTAQRAGARLVSLDTRAARTYAALAIEYELLP